MQLHTSIDHRMDDYATEKWFEGVILGFPLAVAF
jgi:hypothetical protein